MKYTKLLTVILITLNTLFSTIPCFAQAFDDLNEKADKEYAANNYQKAIELATTAINLKVNPRSYFIRADSRFSLKDYEAAIEDYDKAISDYSSYYATDKFKGRLYYWRARCKQNLEKFNEAITDFGTSLSYNFEDAGFAYWNRGNSYYGLLKYKESDDDYAKAIDRITDTKDLASLYKYRGDCNGKQADYAAADKYYSRAIGYNPNYYYAYWWRGYYRVRNGKDEDALVDYLKAVSLIEVSDEKDKNEDLGALYRNIALLHYDAKKNEAALAAINKSLVANPNYVKGFQTRADIYLQMKNYAKSKADYNNAISLVNDDKIISNLYFERSYKIDWKTLDYKGALDALNKSIALDKKDGMKYWHRAITYGYKKDYLKAMADCNKAIELYGETPISGLYILRASIKERSGDVKGAVSDYQVALKADNNNASIYYELGRLFKTKMKNNDLGETNLSKAMEISKPEGTSATHVYAKMIRGESAEAIAMILQKVEKYKDDDYQYPWQLHNAACIYALSGNKIKALEFLDKSLAAGFNDYDHLVNDKDLVSLTTLPQYNTILAKHKVPKPVW